jgi:hypothetical protein
VSCNDKKKVVTIDGKLQVTNSYDVHVGNLDKVVRDFELANVSFLVPCILLGRKRQ